jgi:hypothetical protein
LVCLFVLLNPNSYTINTLLGILFSSILYTCPNQSNLFSLYCLCYGTFFNNCINLHKLT